MAQAKLPTTLADRPRPSKPLSLAAMQALLRGFGSVGGRG